MTKLIIGRHWFGNIYIDEKDELGLGPGDWVMLGIKNTAGSVGGRFAVIENGVPARRASPAPLHQWMEQGLWNLLGVAGWTHCWTDENGSVIFDRRRPQETKEKL